MSLAPFGGGSRAAPGRGRVRTTTARLLIAVATTLAVLATAGVLAPAAVADPAPTTTVLTPSTTTVVYGQPVTLTATVAAVPPATGTPGAVVGFYDGTTLIAAVVPTNGVATMTTAGLDVGAHSLTAASAGGPNFAPSTSPAVVVTVQSIPTTTALSSGAATTTVGQPVTLTARVALVPPSVGVDNAVIAFFDGSTLLGWTVPVNATATFTTRALLVGTHTLTAMSGGSKRVASSTSPPISVTVVGCGCDWPQFRGGPMHTGVASSETTLSPGNVAGLTAAWADTLSGMVQSSPAVVNGIIYVGTSNDQLVAVNASTGAVVWHQNVGTLSPGALSAARWR